MKEIILADLLARVNEELRIAEYSVKNTVQYAREGDVKSDGKYDTRGIEAGYLAGAQMRRVEELKLERQMLEELPCRQFTMQEEVALGAVVDIALNNQVRRYFVSSTSGGTILKIAGQAILVISIFSPIGDAVLGKRVGEEFELETPQGTRFYQVKAIS